MGTHHTIAWLPRHCACHAKEEEAEYIQVTCSVELASNSGCTRGCGDAAKIEAKRIKLFPRLVRGNGLVPRLIRYGGLLP